MKGWNLPLFSIQHILCLPFALCILYVHFRASFGNWLVDLHWIRALTVLMHLGLTDGPFVPHNVISVQESAVPLPKFQMVPRLKILMSSGSKKGTQIYYPFLSKSPGKRIPSMFPNGAPMERDTRLQGIFTSLLIYLFIPKVLRKERRAMFPKSGVLMETDAHSWALLNISFGAPVKEPSVVWQLSLTKSTFMIFSSPLYMMI